MFGMLLFFCFVVQFILNPKRAINFIVVPVILLFAFIKAYKLSKLAQQQSTNVRPFNGT